MKIRIKTVAMVITVIVMAVVIVVGCAVAIFNPDMFESGTAQQETEDCDAEDFLNREDDCGFVSPKPVKTAAPSWHPRRERHADDVHWHDDEVEWCPCDEPSHVETPTIWNDPDNNADAQQAGIPSSERRRRAGRTPARAPSGRRVHRCGEQPLRRRRGSRCWPPAGRTAASSTSREARSCWWPPGGSLPAGYLTGGVVASAGPAVGSMTTRTTLPVGAYVLVRDPDCSSLTAEPAKRTPPGASWIRAFYAIVRGYDMGRTKYRAGIRFPGWGRWLFADGTWVYVVVPRSPRLKRCSFGARHDRRAGVPHARAGTPTAAIFRPMVPGVPRHLPVDRAAGELRADCRTSPSSTPLCGRHRA